ncbi:MAG: xanthine dehydrogenase family protein molybdopterin-binding subunit [Acidobacteria bacterium]|nr:xanthine dehydrogenase family protein molybdopterin-binding subunit [Acidobacteriota bacterium]
MSPVCFAPDSGGGGGASTPAPWGETKVVGARLPRVDAYERVSGSAVYTLDLQLPGMLHAAIVRCPHAHARVKRIDTAKAETMPGVRGVLTGESPGAAIPWYQGREGPLSLLFDPHCRHEGEEVAAVAADTALQAHDAARAVVVEYEELPFVVDPDKALAPDAPKVHDWGNLLGQPRVTTRGDVAAGFAAADAVVEMTFRTPVQMHTPMEVHVSVAQWDGDRLTVWDSTQGVYAIREALAGALKLPLASVRVVGHYMGGGFGSKLELGKYTVIAALLARRLGRPVKAALTREETFLVAGNRPSNVITLKAGAKRDGALTALEARLSGPVGAYPTSAVSAYQIGDLYTCPNVKFETTNILIHAGKARPFRAPGFPSCNWALEQVVDTLAEKLGLDPVELRLKNIPTVSQLNDNAPYTSTGLARCLTEGAVAFGWTEARRRPKTAGHLRRGVGVAAGMWGYGGDPNATAIVTLYADGSVNLNTGASDLGTGTKTVLAMVVAEELGVAPDRIQVEHADTATTKFAPSSGGSQTVLVNSPAVRAAAIEVKRQVLEIAARQLDKPVGDLAVADGAVVVAGAGGKRVPFSELKGLGERRMLVGVGMRHPHPEGKLALPFAAQFAEVEVDTRSGAVRVLRVLAAQDSGRVMNRLTFNNQVFGGVVQGLGFALTEERVLDRATGKMVNANWHDYKVPTMLDSPAEAECLPIDPHDTECNTVGAKGLGEPAHIPAATAIANAIHDAVGVRPLEAPVTPARLVALLAAQERKG